MKISRNDFNSIGYINNQKHKPKTEAFSVAERSSRHDQRKKAERSQSFVSKLEESIRSRHSDLVKAQKLWLSQNREVNRVEKKPVETVKEAVLELPRALVIEIADTNAHDVLSFNKKTQTGLSEHTESVQVKLEGKKSYTASDLADLINSSIKQMREPVRPLIEAQVENGDLVLKSLETGETSEITMRAVTRKGLFKQVFGSDEIKVNGSGGSLATLATDGILSEGRPITSGGNRVALRYWSSDGEVIDKRIVTEQIDKEFISGQEILDLYNKAFEEQADGAIRARFDDEGKVLFESTKGGEDNGFRLVRMGGNFTAPSSETYATIGTGGEAASLNLSEILFKGAKKVTETVTSEISWEKSEWKDRLQNHRKDFDAKRADLEKMMEKVRASFGEGFPRLHSSGALAASDMLQQMLLKNPAKALMAQMGNLDSFKARNVL